MPTIAQSLVIAQGHHRAGRLELAEDVCRRILAAAPEEAGAWLLLGVVVHAQGKRAAAIDCFRRTVELNPDSVQAHFNLGTLWLLEKKYDEAIACLGRALALDPNDPQVQGNLGNAFRARGEPEKALGCYRRAVELQPDDAGACNNLGLALADLGRGDEALAWCRRALAAKPDFADAHYNLGNILREQGAAEEAIACYRRSLELQPGLTEARYSLGNLYRAQGMPEEAIECYAQALQCQPDCAWIHDNLLSAMHYRPSTTLADLAAAHAEYDRRHAAPLRAAWRPAEDRRDPDSPLRLGFVSADFGCHPVGRFLIRTLENIDQRQCQIACYNDRTEADELSARFRSAATTWHDVFALGDEELADRIRADRIDVLFDLAGHTARNRLLVFARRPASVQVSWIGYEGTTGLKALDYLLADRYLVPSAAEWHYCERVLRLPESYVCYDPPAGAPPVGPLPALAAGRATFASFNNPAKITREVVATWAELLRRVPNARLLLKFRGLERPSAQSRLRRWFAEQGVAAERIELAGWSPYREYLAAYGQADIALDPFPFNGGVTSCDALWMGVPLVTCPGETFASRHSLSHLSTVGLTETIAGDLNEYVELAAKLAEDLPRLAEIRAGLRQRVAGSPLCDGRRLADALLELLRSVRQ